MISPFVNVKSKDIFRKKNFQKKIDRSNFMVSLQDKPEVQKYISFRFWRKHEHVNDARKTKHEITIKNSHSFFVMKHENDKQRESKIND